MFNIYAIYLAKYFQYNNTICGQSACTHSFIRVFTFTARQRT